MAHVARPAEFIGDGERLHQMPAGEIGAGDVSHFAAHDKLIERAQNFLDRSERVEAVEVIDVDVVRTQPAQAGFASADKMIARRSQIVRAGLISHAESCLGRDQYIVAAAGNCFPKNCFGESVGVDVGRIEEIHARFQADIDKASCLGHVACAPGFKEFVSATKCARAIT